MYPSGVCSPRLEPVHRVSLRDDVLHVLQHALPELANRAGRDRVLAIVDDAEQLAEGQGAAHGLTAAAVRYGEDRRAIYKQADADGQVLRAAVASGRSAQALADLLRRRSSKQRARWGSTSRWLDHTALEDALVRDRFDADQTWEFAAAACATLPLASIAQTRRDQLRLLAIAIGTDRGTRWPARVAAMRLLGGLAQRETMPEASTAEARRVLRQVARDADDDPWVQSAALSAWLPQCTEAERHTLLGFVLSERTATDHPDHVFARARAAEEAGRYRCWDLVSAALCDESEHVAMTAAAALSGSSEPSDAEALIAAFASEARWRVGARGVVAWVARDDVGAWQHACDAVARASNDEALFVVLDAMWGRVVSRQLPEDVADVLARFLRGRHLHRSVDDARDLTRLVAVLGAWSDVHADVGVRDAWEDLAGWIAGADEGDARDFTQGPVARLAPRTLQDVLFTLSHEDLDLCALPLGTRRADRGPSDGWRIFLGNPPKAAWWRIQHEATHPRHDKRQAKSHMTDDIPLGPYVAWSGRMAEVVATEVPGRRVASPRTLSWDEHLPLASNLIVAARHGEAQVRTPDGLVRIRPTQGVGRLAAHRAYLDVATMRGRLSDLPPSEAIAAYDKDLAERGFQVERTYGVALAAGAWWGGMDWLGTAGVSDAYTAAELSALSIGAIGWWTVGKVRRENRLHRWRERIPLVVGGWGSRGKSSVERLKASLFHGLGYAVLCKSTGCEAMVLMALPGRDAEEVFLYRPRDKATIVEQHTILELAAMWRPQVVLWECMALNPVYTGILQREWMRDDLTTVTNTYPDHEDIQGPSGRDVADVIAEIVPDKGRLITSEHHMTPVLARRARDRQTAFGALRPADWTLLPKDLLERFPYNAYDRNVALVGALAGSLGIRRDVAIRTMADHVLLDLGAFKRFGPIDVDGRETAFVNGFSANDRASFLSNWERAALSDHEPATSGLSRFLVTVLNNRADRLARQAMFARIAALDVAADRVVIIGTNVGPMRDAIDAALQDVLVPRLVQVGEGVDGRAKLSALFADRLRRTPMAPGEARAALEAAGEPEGWGAAWLEEVTWLHELGTGGWDIAQAAQQFTAFFMRRITPFPNPAMKGDAVLRDIVAAFPEGSQVEILGCENIKGTGLDFVYRWVSVERVLGWLSVLEQGAAADVRDRLERMAGYDGYGLYDARFAVAEISRLRDEGRFAKLGADEDAEAALAAAEAAVRYATEALAGAAGDAGGAWGRRLRGWWRDVDVVGSVRRKRRAEQLYRAIGDGRVGLARAAKEAKALVDEEKG